MKQKFPTALLLVFVLAVSSCSKNGSGTSTPSPIADFTFSPSANSNLHAPAGINFTSTSTNSLTSQWNYGDGNTGSGSSSTHKYVAAGTFSVTLTASGTGGSSTKNQSVSILAAYTQVKINKIYLSSAGAQSGAFTGYFRFTNSNGTTELWKSANLSFPGTYPVSYTIPTPYVFTNLGATYQVELWKYNSITSDVKLSNTAFIPGLFNLGNDASDSYPSSVPGVNGFSSFDTGWQ
jgi:PKD repeat protein